MTQEERQFRRFLIITLLSPILVPFWIIGGFAIGLNSVMEWVRWHPIEWMLDKTGYYKLEKQ